MRKGQCIKCGSMVESLHRHDLVWCDCKESFLDGGDDYYRAGGYMIPLTSETNTDNPPLVGGKNKKERND